MAVDFLLDIFAANPRKTALICGQQSRTYGWLAAEVARLQKTLSARIKRGAAVMLEGDYSPSAVAHLLALIQCGCIVAPMAGASEAYKAQACEIAQVQMILAVETGRLTERGHAADHPLYEQLRRSERAGLVLFSSGSTGKCKAIVHDATRLLAKYRTPRKDYLTLAFLLFDHIGGLDTLFYCLSNASTLIIPADRSPTAVFAAVEKHRVQVLPVSPTFLNLAILAAAHAGRDLSSLKYVTYGSEVMPEITLRRCADIFPGVTLLQKYGATEIGALRCQSKGSDSPWVRVGGEGYETRIVDGMLQVKAASSMLGYLNAPSPFTDDGWFITGDAVEVDGPYIRILGRQSQIINVGGQKVYPAEVETVIQEVPGVAEVTVFGQSNPIIGQIVCAIITPATAADAGPLILRVKAQCRAKLAAYQVPMKIELSNSPQHGERFKKVRSFHAGAA